MKSIESDYRKFVLPKISFILCPVKEKTKTKSTKTSISIPLKMSKNKISSTHYSPFKIFNIRCMFWTMPARFMNIVKHLTEIKRNELLER